MAKSLHTPDYVAFSRVMQRTREEAGLTQEQLAKRLHKPQSFVSKLERCERRIDLLEFLDLCVALNVDPAAQIRRVRRELGKGDEVS